MVINMAISPMMQQYLDIKSQYEDSILFFRLGDFYEMFYDDARVASKELELVLTGKLCGDGERAPMCGVPYHSADTYIGKLISRGYKVVICEQTEDPATAKGIVSRDVVRIITPGTVTDQTQLPEGRNNYVAAIALFDKESGLALADISTGEIRATRLADISSLINELSVYSPREVLVNYELDTSGELYEFLVKRLSAVIGVCPSENFEYRNAAKTLLKGLSKKADEISELPTVISALGALVSYIAETQKTDLSYLKNPYVYEVGEFLEIDSNSRRNLEISETMRSKDKKGTLLWVLDKTKTALGARLLKKWLDLPLKDPNAIVKRQNAVESLVKDYLLREGIAELLKPILDVERIMTRIVYATAGGKDLRGLSATLSVLPELRRMLISSEAEELVGLAEALDTLEDLNEIIIKTIKEDPPFSVREGGFINSGVNEELDRLRLILSDSKGYLDSIEKREKETTGIKNLKIGYNRVFGYYIEVSKSNVGEVPDSYIRKQTLTTGERYITPELKELEATILGAADKINAIEYEIFKKVTAHISDNVRRIQASAEIVAEVDVYMSLATVAVKNSYVRPEVDLSSVIDIKEGRHPVVELFCKESGFVPNDTLLDTEYNRLIMLTGPNMAGKSTYMRQIALITIMAQAGSFVPATEARIGIVDKLFTRVGASDDLANGQSTFMLEMTEVSYILKNATKKSLIIYDEIGRGTSTFDGMSIAKAVAEYTASKKIGAKTLFATHYHELCELADEVEGVVNYSIIAKKKDKGIVFLRKIVRGAADDSYGIEVAQLAGIPSSVVKRAREVLSELESADKIPASVKRASQTEPDNFTFDDYLNKEVIEKLRVTDIETLTPLEALNLIFELKKLL